MEKISEAGVGGGFPLPGLRALRTSGAENGAVKLDKIFSLSFSFSVEDEIVIAAEKSAKSGSYRKGWGLALSVSMGWRRILCGLTSPCMIPASWWSQPRVLISFRAKSFQGAGPRKGSNMVAVEMGVLRARLACSSIYVERAKGTADMTMD